MKKLTLLLVISTFIFSASIIAQVVPNGGFENWETNQAGGMQPVGWQAVGNSSAFTNVMQVDGHGGGSAAQLTAVNILGVGVLAPSLFSDEFGVDQNYAKMTGYIKGNPVGNDTLYAIVGMYAGGGTELVGAGLAYVTQQISDFTEFTVNIYYNSKADADSCNITFIAGTLTNTGFANEGTTFTVDDITLSGIAGIEDVSPVFEEVGKPYPSPATNLIHIPFTLAEPDDLQIMVFDVTGKIVLNKQPKYFGVGSNEFLINTGNLKTGTYICSIIPSDGKNVTRKFMIK